MKELLGFFFLFIDGKEINVCLEAGEFHDRKWVGAKRAVSVC